MTNTKLSVLSADTDPGEVSNHLADLTDGSFEVVAYEVFDHPSAIRGAGLLRARQLGVDPGSNVGVWVLGEQKSVLNWLAERGYKEFSLQYSAGPNTAEDVAAAEAAEDDEAAVLLALADAYEMRMVEETCEMRFARWLQVERGVIGAEVELAALYAQYRAFMTD